ncbi:FecR domain-containing protein, partial [Leptolyngbya cf. ectocarpi LEGE 11479]
MEKLKIVATGRWLSLMCASLGMLLSVPGAALAQSTLTWARVELTRNEVNLFTNGQSRRARVSDVLGINDALSTASRARAELRFNDGSLARIGESAVFRFTPNTRNFRLSNGTVLLLIPPGQGRTTIQTPNAVTGIHGSALFVRFVPETDTTIIGALTNNPDGPMMAFNHDGSEQQPLFAGEMAVLRGEQPIKKFLFDMELFYDTNSLGEDLYLDDPEASTGDEAIDAVKQEILDALAQQTEFDDVNGPVVENPAFLSASPVAPTTPVATVPDFNVSPASTFLQQSVTAEGFETIVAPT